MAKKQKKAAQAPKPMSVERYIREKARRLPVDKCYISSGWEDEGLAIVIVTRRQPSGKFVMGRYLVDTHCLGVKDCDYRFNVVDEDIRQTIEDYEMDFDETTYAEVHNLILGAIEFAEEAGFKPHPDFNIAQYILDEDSDDIPLIEYDYGINGRHSLTVNEFTDPTALDTLARNLGTGNFDVTYAPGFEPDENTVSDLGSHFEEMRKWHAEHPAPDYAYQLPEYPARLELKHQCVAELLDPKYFDRISGSLIDRILALPPEEAAADLSALIMYAIGRIHADTDDFPDNSAIFHAVLLLGEIGHPVGLDALLELMRQSFEWINNNLGDVISEEFGVILSACALGRIDDLERFMYEPGLDELNTAIAPKALTGIAVNHPEMRGRVIEFFRGLLTRMVDELPRRTIWGPAYAGSVMSNLIDLSAEELLPEIKRVYDTGWVEPNACGSYDNVKDDILAHRGSTWEYRPVDLYDTYSAYKFELID